MGQTVPITSSIKQFPLLLDSRLRAIDEFILIEKSNVGWTENTNSFSHITFRNINLDEIIFGHNFYILDKLIFEQNFDKPVNHAFKITSSFRFAATKRLYGIRNRILSRHEFPFHIKLKFPNWSTYNFILHHFYLK